MDTVKIGIIGTGWIAEKMAITLEGMEGVEAYAVASRQLQTACDFADRWGFTRAYGSYEEMLDDEEVELVYIATPHSHHFEHARMESAERQSGFYAKRHSPPMPVRRKNC